MSEFFQSSAAAVNSITGIVSFCLAIVAVAAVLYHLGFSPASRRLERQLRNALKQIELIERPTDFYQRFEEINVELRSQLLLSGPWSRFTGTIIYPQVEGDRRALQSSTDPETHFNSESLLEPSLNLRFFSAVPNFLTGAGILGTFIGLVAGIYLASTGLQNPKIEEVKQALQQLLQGASLAFATSIIGLFSSIAFSIAEKHRIHAISVLISRWNSRLSELVERVFPEQLAKRQVDEAIRQTRQLERFNTDLAVSVAESLQDRLSGSFGPTLERLVAATEAVASNQVRTQEQLLRDLVGQFRESLSGAAGTEMATLQLAFREATSGLGEAITGMQIGQNRLVAATDSLTDKLSRAVESSVGHLGAQTGVLMTELAKSLDQATSASALSIRSSGDSATAAIQAATQATQTLAGEASARAEQATRALDQLVARNEELIKSQADATEALAQVSSRLTDLLRQVDESARPLVEIQRRIEESSQSFAQTGRLVSGSALVLKQGAELSERATHATAELWKSYDERFRDVDKALASVFQQIQHTQEAHTERVSNFIVEMDKNLGEAVDQLSAVVKELMDSVESLQDTLESKR